jgi:Uma2 family endonuclease
MAQAANLIKPVAMEHPIVYPESDEAPMAENTIQYRYIVTIQPEIDSLFAEDPNVFVAADLFWYPVEGHPEINCAPDTMVVFGRPKGDRGSYKQWEEGGIAPQVVFEIVSPGNTWSEMYKKRKFYQQQGVEEYYEYDPQIGALEIWLREGKAFRLVADATEWRSARLGITLRLEENGDLSLYRPDGRKFLTPVEQEARARAAEGKAAEAESRATEAEARAGSAEQAREQLAAKLRELGVDPDSLT